jgi:cell division transport system permease protein
VVYISKDDALDIFRARHSASALVIEALDELGENPLEASLNVRAQDPTQYAAISDFLLNKNYPIVDKINYFENQVVIDRLATILGTVRSGGMVLTLLLAAIAVLVSFNTIRLAIFTMREEVGIMRFVGATQWFIRGPFIISGILYGLASATLTTLVFFPVAWLAAPRLLLLVPTFDLFQYFLLNIWEFYAIMLATGIGLGVVSSMISIRRYLRV